MKAICVLLAAPLVVGSQSWQEVVHENGNVARDVQVTSLHSFVLAQNELAPLVTKEWFSRMQYLRQTLVVS